MIQAGLSHSKLLHLHVTDGDGRSRCPGPLGGYTKSPPRDLAWCLILEPDEAEGDYKRIGLVKLPNLGKNFRGQWEIRTLGLF
jgi:hypothetical protein